MSRATSSTRSVMMTRSLCPRRSWACCASCTLMAPSSSMLALHRREHSHCTSCAQRPGAPKLTSPKNEALGLFVWRMGRFYHNHHRYKSGKRKGQAPIELMTGQTLQSDWIDLLLHQVAAGHQVAGGASEPSRTSLGLLPHPLERPRPAQLSSEPACVKTAADGSDASTRQRDKAA